MVKLHLDTLSLTDDVEEKDDEGVSLSDSDVLREVVFETDRDTVLEYEEVTDELRVKLNDVVDVEESLVE